MAGSTATTTPLQQQIEADALIAQAIDRVAAGDASGVVKAIRGAAAAAPTSAMTAVRMAEVDAQTQRGATARLWLRRVDALSPDLPAILIVLARLLRIEAVEAARLRKPSIAARRWHGSLTLEPSDGDALLELASLRSEPEDKERILRRSMALRLWSGPLINLGNVAKGGDRLAEATRLYRRALVDEPASAFAFNNLAITLRDQAELPQAIFAYRCALAIDPRAAATESNYVQALQFDPSLSDTAISAAHRRWDTRHANAYSNEPAPAADCVDPKRPLRIGYVSADFRRHPVGIFLQPVLEAHDRSAVWVACYATKEADDEVTTGLRHAADAWFDVQDLDDEKLAERIRADRIDILVDLSGHTAYNRLLVFARRPAPVQATWLGYFDTTGMSAIDYMITDAWEVPPGHESRFSEHVVRLSAGRFAFRPPAYAPPVAAPPCMRTGKITFGSFNNLGKLTEPTIRLWSKILSAVDHSRLLLKWSSLADPAVAASIRERFSRHGISPERIELRGASAHPTMLAEYGDLDIALDPFPFSGCLTTVEALWMGVPVVSLEGGRPVSRQSAAILQRLDLDDLVAIDEADYERRSMELATSPDRLTALRNDMRRRMKESTLLNGRAVTASLESAYREMWQERCRDRLGR